MLPKDLEHMLQCENIISLNNYSGAWYIHTCSTCKTFVLQIKVVFKSQQILTSTKLGKGFKFSIGTSDNFDTSDFVYKSSRIGQPKRNLTMYSWDMKVTLYNSRVLTQGKSTWSKSPICMFPNLRTRRVLLKPRMRVGNLIWRFLLDMLKLRVLTPRCITNLKILLKSFWLKREDWPHLNVKEWIEIFLSRNENMVEKTNLWKLLKFWKLSWSKLRVKTESHTDFHLFERMLVVEASLVGRKERMWQSIESCMSLILSAVGIDRGEGDMSPMEECNKQPGRRILVQFTSFIYMTYI